MKWIDYFYKKEQTQKNFENIMEFLVTRIFVEECFNDPFGIQIFNGRKRKNFLKAMIYSTISKFNTW